MSLLEKPIWKTLKSQTLIGENMELVALHI